MSDELERPKVNEEAEDEEVVAHRPHKPGANEEAADESKTDEDDFEAHRNHKFA